MVAADNITKAILGETPSLTYEYEWPIDSFIKLTLGLVRSLRTITWKTSQKMTDSVRSTARRRT